MNLNSNEEIFGDSRASFVNNGDFTERYLYQLRGSVGPKPKIKACSNDIIPFISQESERVKKMELARKKVNRRRKSK